MALLNDFMDAIWQLLAMVAVIAVLLAVLRGLLNYLRGRRRVAAGAVANGASNWNAIDDIEPDRLKRLWNLLNSRGKVGLAVAAAVLLATAQFFTTRLGLSNFIPWLWVAIMAAIGIQVILYLGAWLVAERSADKAYLRRKRREEADGIGDAEELKRAEAAVKSSGSAWTVIMFATGLWVSVFFSFDALFDHVYLPAQQLLNNLKVARSTIGSMFGSMEKKIEEDRNDDLRALTTGKDWLTWQGNLANILNTAESSKDVLQAAWVSDNNRLQRELADARQTLQQRQESVAKLKAEIGVLDQPQAASGPAQPPANNAASEIKQAEDRREEIQRTIADLERQRDDIKAKLDTEDKTGGKDDKGNRRPAGQGPVWHELKTNLTDFETQLAVRRRALDDVKRKLETLKRDAASAEDAAKRAAAAAGANRAIKTSELERAESEVKDLTLKVKDAETRYRAFSGDGDTGTAALTGVGDQVLALRRALVTFNGSGNIDAYNTMLSGCNALVDMLARQEKTKQLLGSTTCDATALAPRISKLAAFEDAMVKYRGSCRVDDAFNAMIAVKEMVDRARICAGLSSLPFNRISYERGEIDRIEQENSPATSHFERAIATLSRGDKLAWLALSIAFSIDFLVLVAAMLGARAADHVAPQAVLDSVSAAQFVDLTIRDDDPLHIRNQKKLLSLIRDDFEPLADGAMPGVRPVIDLFNVPPDVQAAVQPMLTIYASNGMAHVEARRPGIYLLSRALLTSLGRDVGLYEKRRARRRQGVAADAGAAPRGTTPNEAAADPLEPASFAARRRRRMAAAAERAQQAREGAARSAQPEAEGGPPPFRTRRFQG
jgi:hypothetical protein